MKKDDTMKAKAIEQTENDIEELVADTEQRKALSERLIERGYCKRVFGKWELDTTYTGKTKLVYICSECGHWQTGKKKDNRRFHMNFCPFCGARMIKK